MGLGPSNERLMGSAQFQGFVFPDGLVNAEELFGVRPAGTIDLRGMAMTPGAECFLCLTPVRHAPL